MCLARCSLRVKLRLQGGNSVQKNRWPFFFLEGLFVSLVTLSLSEPSLSSSSPSAISTSCCEATDCVDLWELPRLSSLLFEGVSLSSREGVKGDEGSGRWLAIPPKLLRVGVFTDGSSARMSSTAFDSGKKRLFGRGVVGVVSSPPRPVGGSGTVRVVLTAWKVVMLGGAAAPERVCCSAACTMQVRRQRRGAYVAAQCSRPSQVPAG
jgi:hypothetical protein